jgi:PAS domain S-box-containing protein
VTRHNVLSALAPVGKFAQLLPEAILLVSGEGLLLTANQAAAHLFGRSADELVGRSLAQFCLDEERAVAALIRTSARTRQLVPGSLRISLPDGGQCACRCEGAVYQPRSAQAPATVMLRMARKEAAVSQFILLNQRIDDLSREVIKRRRVESELRATTERLRVTLGSIGDAVMATDDAGRITFMNPVAEQLTGWQFERACGRHLDEVFMIVHEETGQPVESPVAKALRCGTVVGLANHTVLIRADGARLPIDDSGAPMRDENGAVMGVVVVFHDISERHAMQRELVLRAQRLEEADRRKDEFLSMLAHELRNPLAPLRMGVQLLARKHGGVQDVSRLAEMMERQTGHMVRLVDDLLDVSRLTRGTIALHRARVSLAEVVEQAIEMCQPAMQARGVTLAFEPWPADAHVEGDSTRLVQVFANLLSNATKFTESGGQVIIRARVDADRAVVSVRDSGIGMDAELLPRVFDLFMQGERSLDRSQGGLGVGLTIVRSIVELHGGTIRAHSDGLGHGSEFVVSLPLVASVAQPDDPGASAPATPLARPQSALRILVVDDNVDAAQTLCSILERWGHETRPAYSAQDALELLPVVRPDAVLLDIGLPGMNGYELARAIRLLPGLEAMLLVAVTGYGDENARLQSSRAGCDHHLTKPVDPETLLSLLSRHSARTA